MSEDYRIVIELAQYDEEAGVYIDLHEWDVYEVYETLEEARAAMAKLMQVELEEE